MKTVLLIIALAFSCIAFGQSVDTTTNTNKTASKQKVVTKKKKAKSTQKAIIKGAIQRKNSKKKNTSTIIPGTANSTQSTTPYAPIGTGGAGGDNMSGSRAGSRSERAINKPKKSMSDTTANKQKGETKPKSKS